MPVPTSITDLSTTASSNSPAGSENVGPNADDYIRAHASFIASLRDSPTANATAAVPVAKGGTALTSAGAAGNVLKSTGSAWTSSPDLAFSNVSVKSGTYSVANGDKGMLHTQSGTYTVTLPAISGIDSDFCLWLINIGTGVVTLSCTGGDVILIPGAAQAGASSVTLPYSGSTTGPYNISGILLIKQAAGTWGIAATRETHGTQIFTSSGTWTCPAGVTAAWISGCGGGGGGGGVNVNLRGAAAGGAGGTGAFKTQAAVVPGTAYTVTIGTGGAAGSAAGGNGGTGGTTSIGSLVTLSGGTGGTGIVIDGAGSNGPDGGIFSSNGDGGITYDHNGGTINAAIGGVGGGSLFGGSTRAPHAQGSGFSSNGANASLYGSGGSGAISTSTSHAGVTGGTGSAGILIVEW